MVLDRKLRGYWSIVLAVAGWLILTGAQQPNKQGQSEQANGESHVAQRAMPVAVTISQPIELVQPKVNEPPCGPRQYQAKDDLCAQWKAADSAGDAALWAMVGTMVAAIGTYGLYRQIGLTRQAVEDTDRATKAMLEANRIAEAAQRPWVAISAEVVGIQVRENGYVLFVDVTFENIGQSVAHGFWPQVKTFVASGDYKPSVRAVYDEWAMPKGTSTNVLMPGERFTSSYFHLFMPASGEWQGSDPSCEYVVAASTFYYTSNEMIYDKRCVTQRTFKVGCAKRDPFQRYRLFKADLNERPASDFVVSPVSPRKST